MPASSEKNLFWMLVIGMCFLLAVAVSAKYFARGGKPCFALASMADHHGFVGDHFHKATGRHDAKGPDGARRFAFP